MRWVGIPVAVGLSGLVWAGAGLAADQPVPSITNLKATPSKFCAKPTAGCRHPGTEISFTVSSAARVRGDIRPRSVYRAPFVEFVKNFKKGANSIYMKDTRLTPDRWTLRLQGTNTTGSGNITLLDVRVVKR
jgi:hypothetical protein